MNANPAAADIPAVVDAELEEASRPAISDMRDLENKRKPANGVDCMRSEGPDTIMPLYHCR